jgi:hypothetical protein
MEGPSFSTIPVSIAAGAAISGEIDLGQMIALAVVMPSAWTAATLALQVSPYGSAGQALWDPGNAEYPSLYQPLYNDGGSEITITVAANRVVTLATAGLQNAVIPLRWIKLVSGSSASPVTQAAARQLYLVAKSYV